MSHCESGNIEKITNRELPPSKYSRYSCGGEAVGDYSVKFEGETTIRMFLCEHHRQYFEELGCEVKPVDTHAEIIAGSKSSNQTTTGDNAGLFGLFNS